jgi:hypothetical protein
VAIIGTITIKKIQNAIKLKKDKIDRDTFYVTEGLPDCDVVLASVDPQNSPLYNNGESFSISLNQQIPNLARKSSQAIKHSWAQMVARPHQRYCQSFQMGMASVSRHLYYTNSRTADSGAMTAKQDSTSRIGTVASERRHSTVSQDSRIPHRTSVTSISSGAVF